MTGAAVADPPAAASNGTGKLDSSGGPADEAIGPEEIIVQGNAKPGNLGGKKPTSSSVTLTGGRALLRDNQAYKKGTIVTGTFVAVIDDIGQKDKTDPKTGRVVDCHQSHGARLVDLQVKTMSPQAEQLALGGE